MRTSPNIIEVRDLSHHFSDGRFGLEKIDLSIRRGSFTVMAGANGSGKTTLLRHFNGLLQPQKGTVLVDGVAVSDNVKRARRKVGMVFQDADSQIVGETVYDDAAFGPQNLGWPEGRIAESVARSLELTGLSPLVHQSPHLLSGGEKRRLAIAGVIAMQPDVLLLDEPFANLDYVGVRQVLSHIVELHRLGHTIVISAHDLEKFIAHAEDMVILHQGRVVEAGPPATLVHLVETYGIRMPCAIRMGRPLESWLS